LLRLSGHVSTDRRGDYCSVYNGSQGKDLLATALSNGAVTGELASKRHNTPTPEPALGAHACKSGGRFLCRRDARVRRSTGTARHPTTDAFTVPQCHDAMKRVFKGTADWLRYRGPEYDDRADELERASEHWLRHTASRLPHGCQGVDLRTVSDNHGHASLTTSLYLHAEDDE
jgi:hypothetical protein